MSKKIKLYKKPSAGRVLIAEPFLPDPNFSRAVIFLCEHGEEGSVGFVLNQPTTYQLPQLIPTQQLPDLPVYQGGPVQLDTLHMLHQIENTLEGKKIIEGVYWGGAFDQLELLYDEDIKVGKQVKMFLGYSGWSPGQLEQEVKEGSWLITDALPSILFQTEAKAIWSQMLLALGNDYRFLANAPLNPQLN